MCIGVSMNVRVCMCGKGGVHGICALAAVVGDIMCGCSELAGATICHVGEKGIKALKMEQKR